MKEIMPKPSQRLEKIEGEIDSLNSQKPLLERLIKEGLLAENDPIPEHIFEQKKQVMEKLAIPDERIAEEIVVMGYEIDTHIQNGYGIAEMVQSILDNLREFVRDLLVHDFPHIDEDSVELVISNVVLKHTKDRYFLESLLSAVETRKTKLKELGK